MPTESFRPIPTDPSKDEVKKFLDITKDAWLMAAPGDYSACAVDAFKSGSNESVRLVAVEWPCRMNKTKDYTTVRLMMEPEDAVGLAKVLLHTAKWLKEDEELGKYGQ